MAVIMGKYSAGGVGLLSLLGDREFRSWGGLTPIIYMAPLTLRRCRVAFANTEVSEGGRRGENIKASVSPHLRYLCVWLV